MLVALAVALTVHHAPAHARLMSCAKSTEPKDRAAVFEGSMRAWRQSDRLQLRFRLQMQTPDDPVWRAVQAPGFGWKSSERGVRRFVYDKRVERLLAPASYRVVVRFRWRDASGHVVGHARRITKACHEPDPRPELHVNRLIVYRLSKATARYVAVVANTGRTAANVVAVRFDAAGALLGDASAPASLAPHGTVRVHVDGPACWAGQMLDAAVDPDSLVDEHNETNNLFSGGCTYTPMPRRAHLH